MAQGGGVNKSGAKVRVSPRKKGEEKKKAMNTHRGTADRNHVHNNARRGIDGQAIQIRTPAASVSPREKCVCRDGGIVA